MNESPIGVDELRRRLLSAGQRVTAARDQLCELDAVAGDGDLGVTLATGFGFVERVLGDDQGSDAGALFKAAGVQLARHAPSTIGALWATAFLRVGEILDGVDELDADGIAQMLATAAQGVADRGGAEPGQRTILDAMRSAAAAAHAAADQKLGARDVLQHGAAGAANGAAATADMEPRHGRAGWIAERARGQEDAGARAWAVYLTGLADSLVDGDTVSVTHASTIDDREI